MEKLLELLKQYHEIIAYLFWGVITTVVSWLSYSLFEILFSQYVDMIYLFGMHVSLSVCIANVLSWVCAIFFAFVVNKIWVFQSKSWKMKVYLPELWKFLSARTITGVIEIVAVPFLVSLGLSQEIFGAEGMLAKIIVSIVVVVLNYVFSKLFVFR